MKKSRFVIFIFIICIALIAINRLGNKEISVEVKATDNEPPIISNIVEKIIVAKGNTYKPIVEATDNIDGDITNKIIASEEIDTSKTGEYEIEYSVSDSSGNITKAIQKIEVRNELKNGLPVLMYHFFYSKDDPTYQGNAKDNNLLRSDKFEEQMDYLKREGYYFPTWEEVEDYIDGKMNLPEKSIVITDDDGNFTFFDYAVPIVQSRGVPMTSFVITGWYEERLDETYAHVNYQSHSDDMHKSGSNGKGVMVNWSHDEIVEDLNNSKEKIESHTDRKCTIFCYPFGHYNDTAIQALKDTGYHLAFTTKGGRVKPGDDKFALPRVRINGNTTIEEFVELVK